MVILLFFCCCYLILGFILVRHGHDMALSVSPDCHRRFHGWKVLPHSEVHRRPLRPGVWSNRGGGLLLTPGGDRARKKNQAADLGHRRTREVQVETALFYLSIYLDLTIYLSRSNYLPTYTGLSPELTIVTRWADSYSSTSQTAVPSRTCIIG